MAAYCTLDDILAQVDETTLIQLTDDDGAGAIDQARVDQAIADACARIDGYVGTRYPVPLSAVPAIVKTYAVDIAVYNLYSRRDSEVPEHRTQRYKDALRFCEQVARGAISLGASDPSGNPPASEAPEMSADNPERIFTRGAMRGF